MNKKSGGAEGTESIVLCLMVVLLGCGGGPFSAGSPVSDDGGSETSDNMDTGNPTPEASPESSMPEASLSEASDPETSLLDSGGIEEGGNSGEPQPEAGSQACCLDCAQQVTACIQQNCLDAGSSPACSYCYNQLLPQCNAGCGSCP